MKTTKTILLCLLILCMLFGSLISCANNEETPEDTTGDITTTPVDDQTLEINKDFDTTLNVLIRTYEQYNREWGCEKYLGSDTLSEKILERNKRIEDAIGISMNFSEVGDDSTGNNYVKKVTNAKYAGQNDVDIVSAYAAYSTLPAAMDCFTNLNDTEKFPWFHLKRDYWNQAYLDVAEINGKLYTAIGDSNLSVFDRTIVTYVNKNLASDHMVDLDQIYADVLNGDWTFEKFYKVVTEIGSTDVDGEVGMGAGDFYAVTSIRGSEAPDSFLQAFDLAIFERSESGDWSIVKKTMRTKLEDAINKVENLFNNSGCAYTNGNTADNINRFVNRQAVFNIDVIYHYASTLSQMLNMTDRIGMLPVPKYDDNQKEYKASVQDAHNVVAIIDYGTGDMERYEAISALLEMLNYDSYHNLRPYYFERMIKTRYVDAPEDAQIFDIILASTAWDLSDVYGGFLSIKTETGTMQAPRDRIWRSAFSNNVAVSTRFAAYETQFTTNLNKLMTWIKERP